MRMLSLPVAGPPSYGASPRGGVADPQTQAPPEPGIVVFSGGTAFNSVAGHFPALTTRVTHVLPVSDDGGSTAEIVRVLGGPAVGDIRSRCLRLAGALLGGCGGWALLGGCGGWALHLRSSCWPACRHSTQRGQPLPATHAARCCLLHMPTPTTRTHTPAHRRFPCRRQRRGGARGAAPAGAPPGGQRRVRGQAGVVLDR